MKSIKDKTSEELIEQFEEIRDELDLKTISDWAKANDCVYNTAKKKKPATLIGRIKFIPNRKKDSE